MSFYMYRIGYDNIYNLDITRQPCGLSADDVLAADKACM